jgi:hypothetical protein
VWQGAYESGWEVCGWGVCLHSKNTTGSLYQLKTTSCDGAVGGSVAVRPMNQIGRQGAMTTLKYGIISCAGAFS